MLTFGLTNWNTAHVVVNVVGTTTVSSLYLTLYFSTWQRRRWRHRIHPFQWIVRRPLRRYASVLLPGQPRRCPEGSLHETRPWCKYARFVTQLTMLYFQRKLLAVYLHHDDSILSNVFCMHLLCTETVISYLTSNFITWGWDVSHESNMNRYVTFSRAVSYPSDCNKADKRLYNLSSRNG